MQDFLSLTEVILRVFDVSQSPQSFLVLVILSFARLVTFFSFFPLFDNSVISKRIKAAAAFAMVVVIYPSITAELPANQALSLSAVGFSALLVKEILIGFTLGFIASLAFEAFQIAGRLIDYGRGSTVAEFYAPSIENRISEVGQFKVYLGITLFVAVGAHRLFISAMLRSYEFVPVLKFPKFDAGWSASAELIVQITAAVFSIGLQLAAPVIIVLLLTELCFGIINRFAPQFDTFFLGMPIRMMVGIIALLIFLPAIATRITFYFGETYKALEYIIRTVLSAPQ